MPKKMTDEKKISHLWKRCRAMESGDYFFFKQLHRVVNWYHKELSEKQSDALEAIFKKYQGEKETPKPRKKADLNPHS